MPVCIVADRPIPRTHPCRFPSGKPAGRAPPRADAVRFTVTPLGSAGGRTVGQVVGDIVRYLEPRSADVAGVAPAIPGGDGPSSYYADRGTEVGRWLGFGANEAGLKGTVDATDFARVLAGRDPRTGSRLITAQGSAGRRRTLGAGTETRRAPDGSALYGVADVAASLGTTHREAEGLIVAGERAVQASVAALLGGPSAGLEPREASSFLRSTRKATVGSPRPSLIVSTRLDPAVPIPTRSRQRAARRTNSSSTMPPA